jgi:hypothetical protein
MKFNKSFIYFGICCLLMMGCNQTQQKQETTTNDDDVIWKAEFSYCISSEVPDWQSIRDGYEYLSAYGYNYKIKELKGHYRDIMKIMYDSSLSSTCPLYSLNPVNALAPEILLTDKERHNLFNYIDSIKNPAGQMEAKDYKITFDKIIGMPLNHEWMFDVDAGTLKSVITDECLQTYNVNKDGSPTPKNAPLLSIAGIRFSNRVNDSLYTQTVAAQPGVVWADDCLFSIVDSTDGPHMREYHNWKTDSTIAYTVDGVTTNCEMLYPIKIKSCFDKSLGEWLRIAAINGKIQAYQPSAEDKIGELIPAKDLIHVGEKKESYTYDGKTTTYTIKVSGDDISGIEVKEEMAFHQKAFCFDSKITYAGILVKVKDENRKEIPRTSKVLFWVKLN